VVETVGEEAVGVSATCITTRGIIASLGTIKTRGTDHTAVGGIMGEGGTTNLQTIIHPLLKHTPPRMGGTHHKTITLTTTRAGIEGSLSRHLIRGLRINQPRTAEVAEEDIILDTMVLMVERMGTPEGEEVHLPIEGEGLHMAEGMGTKEAVEEDIGVAVTVVDTINSHQAAVMAGVATVGAGTTLAEATSLVEAINLEVISPVEDITPADNTTPVSNLTVTEASGDVVVGEDTDHTYVRARTRERCSGLPHPCFYPALSSLWRHSFFPIILSIH
jgi:hypothetical protein